MRVLVSVCRGDSCTERGSNELFAQLQKRIDELGLDIEVRCQRGGCYGLCQLGPNLVLREGTAAADAMRDPFASDNDYRGRPGEYHYPFLTAEDLDRIVDEHIRTGRPVLELLAESRPKVP